MTVGGRAVRAGAAAARHQADRPAGGGRPADRAGHARRGRRPRGDRHRARAVSRRAQGRRSSRARARQLKSALLASLGHDLRTPLTAIRVAASNLQASWPDERGAARAERPDPGRSRSADAPVPEHPRDGAHRRRRDRRPTSRWVHPSEIVEAAREPGRAHAARHERRACRVEPDAPGQARSAPDGGGALAPARERRAVLAAGHRRSTSQAASTDDGLTIAVRDHGPGIAPADLPHVFERFYRGANAKVARSGTGMGWRSPAACWPSSAAASAAENCADGGARFTIVVPASRVDAGA